MTNAGRRAGYEEWSDVELDRLYDLFPRTPWPELLAALPVRSRSAIWQMGKNVLKLQREINRRPQWITDETILLRRLYPNATDVTLRSSFPRHSFQAVQRKACQMKLMRPRSEARNHGRFVHPIVAHLYRERQRQHIKRTDLGKRLGYAHGQILGWELGKTKPDLMVVCDWAQALGLEIVARPQAEAPETIVIAFPERSRLMGARA